MDPIKAASTILREIGNKILRWRTSREFQEVSYKKGKEIVSRLDAKAESMIRAKVRTLFPKHKIWGEELGRDSGDLTKEKFIIVDPIDGTKNYLSGVPLFASQIACIERGEVVWGIINLPALKELYVCKKGGGAWCNGRRITPSTQDRLDLAMQCFGIGHDAENYITLASLIRPQLAEPRHYGCAGVHFSFLASGRIDIYIANEAALYDMAAGYLLCKEAGLQFCDLKGHAYVMNENNRSLVIANKKLLREFKKTLQH